MSTIFKYFLIHGHGTDKVHLVPTCKIYTTIQKKNYSELMLLSGSKKCVDLPLNSETHTHTHISVVIIQGILTPTNSCNLQSKSRIEFSIPDNAKTYEQCITYTYNTRNNGQSTSVGLLNKCE